MTRYILIFLSSVLVVPAIKGQHTKSYDDSIALHRQEYLENFINNPAAPLDSNHLADVHFYPANEMYTIEGTFTRTPNAVPFELPTYSGVTKPYVQYGWFTFPWQHDTITMAIYQSVRWRNVPGYQEHLFVPFKDLTNGESTYGGGRYLDIMTGDVNDGRLVMDFNKAYNPWCAYSDGYNCPIPPPENHLSIAVEAGEKMYTGDKLKRPK